MHPSTDVLVDISVDISTDTRPMYRSTYRPSAGGYVGWHIGRVSVDMSTEMGWSTNRPMYQLRYRPSDDRHNDRLLADISVDTAADIWPIRWPYWLSVECRSTIGGKSVKSLDCNCQMHKLYAFHPFLVNLKNFWRLHVRPLCAANSVVIKQDTQVKYCQIHKIQLTGKRIRTTKDNKVLV